MQYALRISAAVVIVFYRMYYPLMGIATKVNQNTDLE
jgi:hypothetical protein